MDWELVVGLETHVALATEEKLFCTCAAAFGGAANTQCCPVCLGQGGTPVLSRRAAALAARAALALDCTVAERSGFDRKHYRAPDLPKGYQITQYERPLAKGGRVAIPGRVIPIRQIHLEEDAGRAQRSTADGVDFNRCGVPLIEIVTAPDFRTPEEVVAYLEELRRMLRYAGVSQCKMQEGSLRCDVNLSVRPAGTLTPGVRTELKNLGSLHAIAKAITHEGARQIALLEGGGTVAQETRRWDEVQNCSHPMRAKEAAADYRYCPEPDLPDLVLDRDWLDAQRAALPVLPAGRRAHYTAALGLSDYDAEMMAAQRPLADFFEATVALGAPPKDCANWVMGHVLRRLSADGLAAEALPLPPAALARLIALTGSGQLTRTASVAVFDAVFSTGEGVDDCIARLSLGRIDDPALLAQTVLAVLDDHPKPAADYRGGKEKALGFLVGQTMARLKGRADPAAVRALLLHQLTNV